LGIIVVAPQTPESFWARVKKTNGCWEWQGKCNVEGYGKLRWHGKLYRAHRIAAWLSGLVETPRGPSGIADTFILHRCDNRRCCNPEHFFLGSQSDNAKDAYVKNRLAKGEHVGTAKLTNIQADEIRKEYAKGYRFQKDIAKEYGVSQSVVCNITRRRTYRNI
jgi:hypothetical protein